MNKIITRFAPSPTGNLHIGSLRTALINYIVFKQAKKINPESKNLLRIEDTDKIRTKEEYNKNIIKNLQWMGINYDHKPYIQSKNIKKHQNIAEELFNKNMAFKCICSEEILQKKREYNKINKISQKRLCNTCENDEKIQILENNYVLRIKISDNSETSISDLVQGEVKVKNIELDNFILLRKNKTPTYMLSVVVDDYEMGVNLIIRGDDHLNNAFRQIHIYKNMNWEIPKYAHIPLIHGEDGKKLSKRHGSVDMNQFKDNGYLKESIINNLILLGWAPPNNDEIISIDEIINKFDINKLAKSSSIFSYDKLDFFNNYYIKADHKNKNLHEFIKDNIFLEKYYNIDKIRFIKIYEVYKKNLRTFKYLQDIIPIYFNFDFDLKSNNEIKLTLDNSFTIVIKKFLYEIEKIEDWNNSNIENIIKNFIKLNDIKFALFGKPIRLLFINSLNGPSISDILYIFGKKNSINIIKKYISEN